MSTNDAPAAKCYSRPRQIQLTGLTPREAITDALDRILTGFDRNDEAMFQSSCTDDVAMQMRDGDQVITLRNVAELRAGIFGAVGPMDTMHMTSNIRIALHEDGKTASMTANALAQHCPPGEGRIADGRKYLVGGEYFLDVVKDESSSSHGS